MVSSVLCYYGLPVYACAYACVSVKLSPVHVLLHPVAGPAGTVANRRQLRLFLRAPSPVPSTATAVQPVSDLCCVHTDTDSQRNSLRNWPDMIAHVVVA